MSIEQSRSGDEKHFVRSHILAKGLQEISHSTTEHHDVFNSLQEEIEMGGFTLANEEEVRNIFNNTSLMCRSEQFQKVIDLVIENKDIMVINDREQANMCTMSYGEGFKIAMTEGFSGNDVGNMVKAVLTFRNTSLTSRNPVSSESDLWRTKPMTARVSIVGKGTVTKDDVVMISLRFPVQYYPEELRSVYEADQIEEGISKFIVRHFVKRT